MSAKGAVARVRSNSSRFIVIVPENPHGRERAERLQQPSQCRIMHLYRDDFHHTAKNHLSGKCAAKEKPKPPMQPSVIRQPQVPGNVPALLSLRVTVIAAEGGCLGPVETS